MAGSFKFKQFSVSNTLSAHKVGTDGVLLGAWVHLGGDEQHILDVGTGTGIIALMLAQRSSATIIGIDIDHPSAEEAAANFKASPWASQMAAFQGDFRGICTSADHPLAFLKHPYDLIVSNPPYFSNSLKADGRRRSGARHTDTLSFGEILFESSLMLPESGRLAVIYPAQESERLAGEALSAGLFPSRICRVYSKQGERASRVMIEFSRKKEKPLFEELTIFSGGKYTEEYLSLTGGFYIGLD